MAKQKIVVKMPLDTERKKRKAFKAAVDMTGVTSATLEGDKLIVVGDGVDPIALTTMLRRSLGHAELLSVSSGDDKKMGHGGMGMGMGFGGGHGGMGSGMGFGGGHGGKEGKEGGGKIVVDGVHHQQQLQQHAMAPPMPPMPVVSSAPASTSTCRHHPHDVSIRRCSAACHHWICPCVDFGVVAAVSPATAVLASCQLCRPLSQGAARQRGKGGSVAAARVSATCVPRAGGDLSVILYREL